MLYFLSLFFLFSFSALASLNENVDIYVWNSAVGGGHHYGHVSLDLHRPNSYISLWPTDQERTDLDGVGCLKAVAAGKNNLEADVAEEERAPDALYRIEVSSDQLQAMETEWRALEEQLGRHELIWFAPGSRNSMNIVAQNLINDGELRTTVQELFGNRQAFNCASIVNHILEVGGVNLEEFLFIGTIHNPAVQGLATSIALGSGKVGVVDVINFFESVTYPDKIGYMAKRKVVDQVTRKAGVPVDNFNYYLRDDTVDALYDIIRNGDFDLSRIGEQVVRETTKIKKARDEKMCALM